MHLRRRRSRRSIYITPFCRSINQINGGFTPLKPLSWRWWLISKRRLIALSTRSLGHLRYGGPWCSGRALAEYVWDPLICAWLASLLSLRRGFFNRPSAVVSLGVPCSDRCCSCSTWVSLLSVLAYLTSTPITLIFTHGASINSCTVSVEIFI